MAKSVSYEDRKLSDLWPYPKNVKQHPPEQIAKIAASIELFGFTAPIVVDEQNTILAGHGRYLALKKMDNPTVRCCILTGLTEAEKRAFRIIDNKLPQEAPWALENLQSEVEFLRSNDFDLNTFEIDYSPPDFSEPPPMEPPPEQKPKSKVACPSCGTEFER